MFTYSNHYTEGDENHGEQQILSKQGNSERCGRNNLGEKKEEHGE